MFIYIIEQEGIAQGAAYLTKEAAINAATYVLTQEDKEATNEQLRNEGVAYISGLRVEVITMPIETAEVRDIDTFKEVLEGLTQSMRNIVKAMPYKGDISDDSQKIQLLNDLSQLEASITGTEQSELLEL